MMALDLVVMHLNQVALGRSPGQVETGVYGSRGRGQAITKSAQCPMKP